MSLKTTRILLILSLATNLAIVLFFSRRIYYRAKYSKGIVTFEQKDTKESLDDLKYTNGLTFKVTGKYHNEPGYNRLPKKFENIVRPELWDISKNSSGIGIRFRTNSPTIAAKWTLINNSYYAVMNKISNGGVDLYCRVNDKWQYVSSGMPTGFTNQVLLITDMDTTYKEFLLNLPIADGIDYMKIGIRDKYSITPPHVNTNKINKPIVFYGTSITQGGAITRPGMIYPSIVSRNLDAEVINLGFKGNGRYEQSVGQALCEIDASMYVIDCIANSTPDTIRNNAPKLIEQLRKEKPTVPVLLVEGYVREYAWFKNTDESTPGGIRYLRAQNKELKQVYENALKAGFTNIYYMSGDSLIGTDHEGTADGTHPSDVGASRIAEQMEVKIKEILKLK